MKNQAIGSAVEPAFAVQNAKMGQILNAQDNAAASEESYYDEEDDGTHAKPADNTDI